MITVKSSTNSPNIIRLYGFKPEDAPLSNRMFDDPRLPLLSSGIFPCLRRM